MTRRPKKAPKGRKHEVLVDIFDNRTGRKSCCVAVMVDAAHPNRNTARFDLLAETFAKVRDEKLAETGVAVLTEAECRAAVARFNAAQSTRAKLHEYYEKEDGKPCIPPHLPGGIPWNPST